MLADVSVLGTGTAVAEEPTMAGVGRTVSESTASSTSTVARDSSFASSEPSLQTVNTSFSPTKQRHRLSQRFKNSAYVGTFGSYKNEEFGPPTSPLATQRRVLPQKIAQENPYVGFLRHAPSYSGDLKKKSAHEGGGSSGSGAGQRGRSGAAGGGRYNSGLFDLLRDTPAHAAVTRIGVINEIWKKRHLSHSLLNELPLISYTRTKQASAGILSLLMRTTTVQEGQTCCAICKSDYEEGESLRLLPCGHVFHKGCADTWLLGTTGYPFIQTNTCPLCKINVAEEIANTRKQREHGNNGIPREAFLKVGQYIWGRSKGCGRRREPVKSAVVVADRQKQHVVATSPALGRAGYVDRRSLELLVKIINYPYRKRMVQRRRRSMAKHYFEYQTPFDQVPEAILVSC
jgi:hypothetical protein